ncbi:hypothetical protein KHP57_15955 [Algiphilus sp. NNCM1]|nr:hypothetical protein [Algiphilus acroporae]
MRRNRVEEPWLSLIFGVGLIVVGLITVPTAADRSAILVSLGISLSGLCLLLYYFVRRRIWEKSLLTLP